MLYPAWTVGKRGLIVKFAVWTLKRLSHFLSFLHIYMSSCSRINFLNFMKNILWNKIARKLQIKSSPAMKQLI